MKNSHPFTAQRAPLSAGEFYAFVSGERWEQHGVPARIAWDIETLAVARGWPVGTVLGSEAWLRGELGVSREAVREAMRIVESRGAMQMRRGRAGGLVLAPADRTRTAAALAAYLRATGIGEAQIARSVRGLDQLLAWRVARQCDPLPDRRSGEGVRQWLARASGAPVCHLFALTLDVLIPPTQVREQLPSALRLAIEAREPRALARQLAKLPFQPSRTSDVAVRGESRARATTLANRMMEGSDAELGNEAELCEAYSASRAVIRQALRILQDLDLVQVRLGRGGGYARKRPSPVGAVRQLFPWLAAEHSCPFALLDMMWDLNSAHLRLAGERLAALPAAEHGIWAARFEQLLQEHDRVRRFMRLLQACSALADCPPMATLGRCIVAYQTRINGELPRGTGCDTALPQERAIVAALFAGDLDRAEAQLRALQDDMHAFALERVGSRLAAE